MFSVIPFVQEENHMVQQEGRLQGEGRLSGRSPVSRRNIPELLQVPVEQQDLPWLKEALQWAVELEFATIPAYLSGLWSIKPIPDGPNPASDMIRGVVLEEMLHLGIACNMLTAIGGIPQITAPTFPGPLPGGVQPKLTVYLAGLTRELVECVYMQIELPEHPLAEDEPSPTIGAFYDAISKLFAALFPPDHQFPKKNQIDNFTIDVGQRVETLNALGSLDDVQQAITTIKEQGEGTATSPDAPQFGGSLAHYYVFGEIFHGKKLIKVDDGWQYAGDEIPFPDCYPVKRVPAEGYPGLPVMQRFNGTYSKLIGHLQDAWSGDASQLDEAVTTMGCLSTIAQGIVKQRLPDGSGNYGPDFKVQAQASTTLPL
jgi:hypothetical protein